MIQSKMPEEVYLNMVTDENLRDRARRGTSRMNRIVESYCLESEAYRCMLALAEQRRAQHRNRKEDKQEGEQK